MKALAIARRARGRATFIFVSSYASVDPSRPLPISLSLSLSPALHPSLVIRSPVFWCLARYTPGAREPGGIEGEEEDDDARLSPPRSFVFLNPDPR